jgi:conjugative transfer signal peptidase TraF
VVIKSPRFWAPVGASAVAFAGIVAGCTVFGGPTLTFGASLPTVVVWYTPRAHVERGQIASVCFPQNVVDFAHRYGAQWPGFSCPGRVGHVFKIVAAVAGDRVRIARDGVYVNGSRFPMSAPAYPLRVLPEVVLGRKFTVPAGDVMLMGWSSHSLDSRYGFLFPESSITGRIYPVWPAAGIFESTNTERQK